MRDPQRCYEFCNELAKIWATKCPDWRFGQFMMNILGAYSQERGDPFYPEEEKLMTFIKQYFNVR